MRFYTEVKNCEIQWMKHIEEDPFTVFATDLMHCVTERYGNIKWVPLAFSDSEKFKVFPGCKNYLPYEMSHFSIFVKEAFSFVLSITDEFVLNMVGDVITDETPEKLAFFVEYSMQTLENLADMTLYDIFEAIARVARMSIICYQSGAKEVIDLCACMIRDALKLAMREAMMSKAEFFDYIDMWAWEIIDAMNEEIE